ncbi:MAG: nitronate monooxygenase [Acidisphaera sp.]|nr:nitronate monooxygenase [Acidisphaera sp.]MBV9813548.1 nitronate monooxygenase [Acetobacteraceae bacterium]
MSLPAILRRLALPVIGSPLFLVSNPDLVIAQCKAGIVGSFPALNARPADRLAEWLKRIVGELGEHDAKHPDRPAAPFAVNQIVHRTNERLAHDLELCVRHRVPILITSLGARVEVNEAAHSYGGIVLHDVIDDRFARKAVEKGADGLIAVAAGAGGHAGTLSPFALVAEIRSWFDGPLVLSGAIATGGAVLAAQAMGADLAYVGSAFIATEEANAAAGYKRMIVESRAADIVYTNLITGVHGNYLKGSLVSAGLDPDNLPTSDASKMSFGDGRKAWRDIWGSGQGIGTVSEIVPAEVLVARLGREYAAARARLGLARSGTVVGEAQFV